MTHRWKFARTGAVDQVQLTSGDDLVHLDELDQKLWVALAMPCTGVQLDSKTLAALDADKDGRVRAPEIREAVRFACAALKNPGDLLKGGGDSLALDALSDGPVRAAAVRILDNLGKSGEKSISLADVADTAKIFANTRFNGDGIVPADSADDEPTRKLIEEIMATHTSTLDRSGKLGIDQKRVDTFFDEVKAHVTWAGEAKGTERLPAGEAAAAADAVRAVRTKLDDYFTRCRLAAFDARAATLLAGAETDLTSLASRELSSSTAEVARLPISKIEGGRALPLEDGVNPAWAQALTTLDKAAIKPILGARKTLSESDWNTLCAGLADLETWQAKKPAGSVEPLGLGRLRELDAGDGRAKITALIARDAELEKENAQIVDVERLLLFSRDLMVVLNNFVNFSEFYGRRGAVFQVGTLFLDGRSCNLCMQVTDPAKHSTLAGLSGAFLAYCDCTRPGGEKMTIVGAFTDGDSDNLIVGRNGLFYDRQGRDWDATIVKLISNPISVRQAFWAPYKKLVRMIEDQVTKRANAADAQAESRMKKVAESSANIDKEKDKPEPKPEENKIDIGTVAAIGVAVGGVGAMVTGILAAFFGLGAWMPVGLVAAMLMVSGPSLLLAWLKLRQRNLGPLLDASGWAINGRARINVPFGSALTAMPVLPEGAVRSLKDPYADKKRPWGLIFFLLLLVAIGLSWYLGRMDRYLPEPVKRANVIGPIASPEPAAK